MTDYTELIKALRVCKRYPESCSYCVEENDYCRQRDMCKAADAIEEMQREYDSIAKSLCESVELVRKLRERVPRWISVTERLPEPYTHVLVFCKFNASKRSVNQYWETIGKCNRDDNGKRYWALYGEALFWTITHWMPLPQPPKEET